MNMATRIVKRIALLVYNKRNNTRIKSILASMRAEYGIEVRIDPGTIVTSDVRIGDYSYVNRNSSLENCTVGKYCSISEGVYICPYNHTITGLTTHPIGAKERKRPEVFIGNDVLISLNCIILEGVHIADGAVIGAGAVVTHDVGPYEVWGGVPAKFIKYRIEDEAMRETLLRSRWWDEPRERVKTLVDDFEKGKMIDN